VNRWERLRREGVRATARVERRQARSRLQVAALRIADPALHADIAQLRRTVRDVSEVRHSTDEWQRFRADVRRMIALEDPRRFLRWPGIQGTMFATDTPYARAELDALTEAGWRATLSEDAVGAPPALPGAPDTSGNLVHHTHHVLRFTEATGRSLDAYDHIVEIGGGYGSFCRVAHRHGYRGRYTIVDLPEFSALQRFYLGQVPGMRARLGDAVRLIGSDDLPGALGTSAATLVVATWSLSELPLELRDVLLGALAPAAPDFLLAYQDTFAGIDNDAWFRHFAETAEAEVITEDVPALPGNRYLFACTRARTRPAVR
jgi:hypothetical protein